MIKITQKYIEKLLALISNCPISFDNVLHENLPASGGVYRIFEDSSDWSKTIYVGSTKNLRERIYGNLFKGKPQVHTLKRKLISAGFTKARTVEQYLKSNCRIQYLKISNEKERKLFEHFAISILKPKYND